MVSIGQKYILRNDELSPERNGNTHIILRQDPINITRWIVLEVETGRERSCKGFGESPNWELIEDRPETTSKPRLELCI